MTLDIQQPVEEFKDPLNQPIDLAEAATPKPMPENVVQERSKRFGGLSEVMNRSEDYINMKLRNGQEKELRDEYSTALYQRESIRRSDVIQKLAKERGQGLTADEIKTVMSTSPYFDPESTPEKEYAKYYLQVLEKPDTFMSDVYEHANPEERDYVRKVKEASGAYLARTEQIKTFLQDAQLAAEDQSTVGFVVDRAKEIASLGLYSNIKQRSNVPGVGFFNGLLGENLQKQFQQLYTLPQDKFDQTMKSMRQLIMDNPQQAVEWATAMLGQSSLEKDEKNFFNFVDIATAPGIGLGYKALKGGFQAAVKTAAKDVVEQGVKDTGLSRGKAFAAAGDLETAAVEDASATLLSGIRKTSTVRDISFENMASALKADATLIGRSVNDPSAYGAEATQRLLRTQTDRTEQFMETVRNRVNVERMDVETAFKEGFKDLLDETKERYPGIRNSILDIKLHYNQSTNTYDTEMVVGKFSAEMFSSFTQAKQFAKAHGLEDAVVQSQGPRFYLSVKTPLRETEGWGKNIYAKTKAYEAPDTFLSSLFGKFRNPDETLSFSQRESRLAGTYGLANIMKLLKEEGNLIKAVANNKTKREQFTRFLNSMKDDAEAEGRKGLWLNTPMEVEHKYMNLFGRIADKAEVDAYFAYKRATEYDRQFRNILMYRNMSRAGVQEHVFSTLTDTGDKLLSPSVKGVKMTHLPATDDTVLFLERNNSESRLFNAVELKSSPKRRKEYEQMRADVENGKLQVVRVFNPEERPLANYTKAGDHYVRYVVTPNVTSKNIDYNGLVPRRGGGHFIYDYEWYIKQARVIPERVGSKVTHNYEGDTTIAGMPIRAMGQDFAKHLEKIRQLLYKAEKEGAGNRHTKSRLQKDAKTYFESNPVEGLSWKEVKGWFQSKRAPGGQVKVPPRLSLSEPIQLVQKDKKLVNIDNTIKDRYTVKDSVGNYYTTFRDATKSGSDNMQLQVQFTGQRDDMGLFSVKNEGTRQNPIYKKVAAEYLDPLTTMDRTYGNVAKSLWMDDYKIKSVENWLAQASKYMKADPQEIRAAPFHWFHAGPSEFKPDAPPEITRNLTTAHMQIQQFLGVRSETDNLLHSAAQRMADSMYNTFGEKSLKIDPLWLMPKLKDPFQFLRSIAFHAKLGLFAVPQLLVQAQTYSVMLGMSGIRNTVGALGAATFTQLTRINKNPAIVEHLDKLMTKLNVTGAARWRPGEFKESLETLHRSGFMEVGREYALRGDIEAPKMITTKTGRFLDAGTVFFTEGERFSRIGAWHAAYKEFRDANPFGRLTDKDIRSILVRADDLTVNMSRASSSMLHSGVMSLPSQFLTYQIRLAELMWGKRLDTTQRMKILAYQAALYGVPTAIGVSGLPLGDIIRKNAIENGYNVGENWIESAVTEGLLALMIALLTGDGDIKKGKWYNIGDRFGSQGFETIREAMRGDKTFWDIVGGAGYSVSKGIWDASDGFRNAMVSLIRGDEDKKVNMTVDDVLDAFKEITSVNQTWKAIAAINTGRWYSKKEGYLTDVTPLSAIFMATTGLQPQDVTDLQLMSWSEKDRKDFETKVEQNVIKQIRRAIRIQNDNPEQADKYLANAKALFEIADYPLNRRTEVIAKASKDYESMIEAMDWKFYRVLDVDSNTEGRFNALARKREIRDLRGKN